MISSTAPPPLTIPLTTAAHELASQFAAEQADPQKGQRVYLNTLAVWAVHCYLSWLQIEADLAQSKSWNPGLRALLDTADLMLPNLGRLECRPVLPEETAIALPPQTAPDCIGYIAVRFSHQLGDVQLLGFAPAAAVDDAAELLPISAFQPLDTLLDRLSELEAGATSAPSPVPATLNPVNLSHWLQRNFTVGWQAIEDLFTDQQLIPAFRRTLVRRAKLMDLPSPSPLVLIVTLTPITLTPITLTPDDSDHLAIHLQVCPFRELDKLPPHLQLQVLTETGDVFREVMAGEADTFIQYEFTGQPGECFGVELVWQDSHVIEAFVV
jgi:hypothetical protein